MGIKDNMSPSEKHELEKTIKHLIAGASARASAAIIMFPVDVIKARLQFQGNLLTNVKRYNGPLHAFKTIMKEEGVKAFFKGLPPRLLYITPSAAVSFALYEQFKKLFYQWRTDGHRDRDGDRDRDLIRDSNINNNNINSNDDNKNNNNNIFKLITNNNKNNNSTNNNSINNNNNNNNIEDNNENKNINNNEEKKSNKEGDEITIFHPLVPLMAGAFARLMGTAARTPFDIIKYRLQVQGSLDKKLYTGTLDAFAKTIKNEGVLALWTGYSISLMRDVPFASIYFLSYEYGKVLQERILQYIKLDERGYTPSSLLAGACAGGIAATCTIPFDAVKTRLQTQATLPIEHQRYKGVLNTFKLTYQEDGVRGFTKGLFPRLLYLMPSASLTFAFYEKYKILLGANDPPK